MTLIVRIFLALPMDWVVRLLRIERLTSQQGQHFRVSMDAALGEATRNDYAWCVGALPGERGVPRGIDEGWTLWCESAADYVVVVSQSRFAELSCSVAWTSRG